MGLLFSFHGVFVVLLFPVSWRVPYMENISRLYDHATVKRLYSFFLWSFPLWGVIACYCNGCRLVRPYLFFCLCSHKTLAIQIKTLNPFFLSLRPACFTCQDRFFTGNVSWRFVAAIVWVNSFFQIVGCACLFYGLIILCTKTFCKTKNYVQRLLNSKYVQSA